MTRRQVLYAGIGVWLALGAAGCSRQMIVESEAGRPRTGDTISAESLRSVLRSVATAEAAYYEANGRYTDDADALDFAAPAGVKVDLLQGDRAGYSAIARSGDAECAIFSGEVRAPRSYVTAPDVVSCRE